MTCRAVGVGCGIAYVVRISRASLFPRSPRSVPVPVPWTHDLLLDAETEVQSHRATYASSVESISIGLAAVKGGRADAIKRIDEARQSEQAIYARFLEKKRILQIESNSRESQVD